MEDEIEESIAHLIEDANDDEGDVEFEEEEKPEASSAGYDF